MREVAYMHLYDEHSVYKNAGIWLKPEAAEWIMARKPDAVLDVLVIRSLEGTTSREVRHYQYIGDRHDPVILDCAVSLGWDNVAMNGVLRFKNLHKKYCIMQHGWCETIWTPSEITWIS